jgi:hypothetical protein
MIYRSLWTFSAALVVITCAVALTQAEQVRRQTGPIQVPIEVSLKVGGQAYVAKGLGSCTHAPKASIYNVPAQLWSVSQQGDGGLVQLTLWKPADGSANMFSLSVKNTAISTVKGGQVTGAGTVTLVPSGKGGTLTVDAKTRTGEAITGTIKCEAFTPHIADGGN